MLLAPCSAKLSAQSPPCRRKASPAATRASALLRLRASPAKTSGGKVASWRSTSASAALSGYSGICRIGLVRQVSGVQRSAMTRSPYMLTRVAGVVFRLAALIHDLDRRRPEKAEWALFGRLALVAHGLVAHGHELFGGGGMHRHD